ncbi:hypothetical protein KC19_12G187700, partial [Ceratodon purpureus]
MDLMSESSCANSACGGDEICFCSSSFKDRKDSRSAGSSMRSFLGSGGFGEACKTREFFSLSSNPCSCALVSFSFSCHSTNSRSFLTTSL